MFVFMPTWFSTFEIGHLDGTETFVDILSGDLCSFNPLLYHTLILFDVEAEFSDLERVCFESVRFTLFWISLYDWD